jgi:hypothetical protein
MKGKAFYHSHIPVTEHLHMQTKRNPKERDHNLIWQKNILTRIMHCISILVLSAIIIVTPSLSYQSQTNSNMTLTMTTAQHNIVKLLADMVRNKLHDAVNLLEITSKDPLVQIL